MVVRNILKGMAACAALGLVGPLTAGTASASPGPSLSFSASSDGAAAGWSAGKGSAIDLTLGSTQGTYAAIELHHVGGVTVGSLQDSPSFATTNYAAGSPRWYITLNNGDTLIGYPPQEGQNGSNFGWSVDRSNTYELWSAVTSSTDGAATVTGAYVIADGDQAAGTTDQWTGLTFGGATFN